MTSAIVPSNGNKSYLSTPEGKVGAVGTTLALGAVGVGLYYLLPPLIVIMTNLFYAMALGGGLAFVGFTALNSRTRLLFWYLYQSFWRAVTGMFIAIDPVGIMEGYREDLQAKLAEMSKQIGILRGQSEQIARFIHKKEDEREAALRLAKAAREAGNKGVLAVQGNQIGRLDKTLKNQLEMQQRIDTVLATFSKMQQFTQLKYEDISMEIDNRKEERKMAQASYGAFTAAAKILRGDASAAAIYNQTTEHLDDDFFNKMGEIGQFVDEMSGAIATMDLERGAFATDALSQIDDWEKRSERLLAETSTVGAASNMKNPVLKTTSVDTESEFSDLFETAMKK